MSTPAFSALLLSSILLLGTGLAQTVDLGNGAAKVEVTEGGTNTIGTKVIWKDVRVSSNVLPVDETLVVMYIYDTNPTDIRILCVGTKVHPTLTTCYVFCSKLVTGPAYVGNQQVTPYGIYCNWVAVGAPGVVSVAGIGVGVPANGSDGYCVEYQNYYGFPLPPGQNLLCFDPTPAPSLP